MLRLTKQADYGIVLLSHMAQDPKGRFAASELATTARIPLPTVSKILKILVREGLLVSHRGVKGGYSLAQDPQQISVAAMIGALDGPIAFTECTEPGLCSQEAICRLRSPWQRINRAVHDALATITLAELTHPLMPPPVVRLGSSLGWLASGSAS